MGNNDKTYAAVTQFDIESEDIVTVAEVEYWAVETNEDLGQANTGINFALEGEMGDLTITDEQLAALGYVKA